MLVYLLTPIKQIFLVLLSHHCKISHISIVNFFAVCISFCFSFKVNFICIVICTHLLLLFVYTQSFFATFNNWLFTIDCPIRPFCTILIYGIFYSFGVQTLTDFVVIYNHTINNHNLFNYKYLNHIPRVPVDTCQREPCLFSGYSLLTLLHINSYLFYIYYYVSACF